MTHCCSLTEYKVNLVQSDDADIPIFFVDRPRYVSLNDNAKVGFEKFVNGVGRSTHEKFSPFVFLFILFFFPHSPVMRVLL